MISIRCGGVLPPIIGAATGGFDFSNYFSPLSSNVATDLLAEAKKQGAALAWGNFLTVLITFVMIVSRGFPGSELRSDFTSAGLLRGGRSSSLLPAAAAC